jgi:hypothetical protein
LGSLSLIPKGKLVILLPQNLLYLFIIVFSLHPDYLSSPLDGKGSKLGSSFFPDNGIILNFKNYSLLNIVFFSPKRAIG